MRGCPFTDATVGKIATSHNVSAAQVCVRWTLQRGAIAALGNPNRQLPAVLHKLHGCCVCPRERAWGPVLQVRGPPRRGPCALAQVEGGRSAWGTMS